MSTKQQSIFQREGIVTLRQLVGVTAVALVLGPALFSALAADGAIPECQDYTCRLIAGHLRVCDGTPWPQATERFVMPLMAANREKFKGKTVLDIGTGSGILAVYAAQLGAAKVVATDIEPRAVDCARENAQRLGLGSVIEARLVSMSEPSAYAVIRPEERFDIVVSFPPGVINREPYVVNGVLDEGITPADNLRLGLSILKGLDARLNPGGVALLCFKFSVAHTIMVNYARSLGFVVEHHPALRISPPDWYALYNSFVAQVARTEKIEPGVLLLPRTQEPDHPLGLHIRDTGDPGTEDFLKVEWESDRGTMFSRLWDGELDRILPGMIVVRKPSARPGSTLLPEPSKGREGP